MQDLKAVEALNNLSAAIAAGSKHLSWFQYPAEGILMRLGHFGSMRIRRHQNQRPLARVVRDYDFSGQHGALVNEFKQQWPELCRRQEVEVVDWYG